MNPERARAMVRERSGYVCEVCRSQRHTDFSHRLAASQLGLYTPSNGVSTCRGCHSWLHASPARARSGGWHLTSGQNPLEVPVWLDTLSGCGWFLLDDHGLALPLGLAALATPDLPHLADARRPRTSLEIHRP